LVKKKKVTSLNGTSSLYLFPALLQTPGKRKALECTAQYRNKKKYIFVTLFLSSKPTQSFLLYLLCLEKIFNFCNIFSYYQVFVLCTAWSSKFG